MACWLAKSEPGTYSYSDLERDGVTEWNGVHNALALQHLKRMRPGDALFFYHSGTERAIVGLSRVSSLPRPDPSDARGSWTVEVRPVRPLRGAILLGEMRGDPALAGLALFRMTRLSVLPVTPGQRAAILAHEPPAGSPARTAQGSPRGSRSSQRVARARKRGAT